MTNNLTPEKIKILAAAEIFRAKLEAFIIADRLKNYPGCESLHNVVVKLEVGRKYARILREEYSKPVGTPGSQLCSASAYGFLDLNTGDILKADGYNKPAKHVRGNIDLPDDVTFGQTCTPNGVCYLR